MTTNEFFEKLKECGPIWTYGLDQFFKSPVIRAHSKGFTECPITAVANRVVNPKTRYTTADYTKAAEALELDITSAVSIVHMADNGNPVLWSFIKKHNLAKV